MSEQNVNPSVSPDEEKEILVNNLKKMGKDAKLSHSLETLRNMYKNALDEIEKEETEEEEVSENIKENPIINKPVKETLQEKRNRIRAEALALVRCRVICHNPDKQQITGEYFTVANEIIGNVRKLVPFGTATDNGYHIPRVLVNLLKNKKYQRIFTKKNENNIQVVDLEKSAFVNEFSIEELEPLTPKELEELKQRQIATRALEDN